MGIGRRAQENVSRSEPLALECELTLDMRGVILAVWLRNQVSADCERGRSVPVG